LVVTDTVEIEKLRRQQTAIANFGSFALSGSDLQAILNEAARVCAQGLGTKYSKICRFRAEEGDLLIEAGFGWRIGLIGNVVSKADESSPQGRAFTTGDPAICEDLTKDAAFKLPEFYLEHGIVSTIDVLIKGAQKAYGVLEVDSDKLISFDQQDIIYLTGFANVLAEALAATEQKAKEAELLATEQRLQAQALENRITAEAAQKTIEARTTFIATMSHEIRTPLNAIVGFSDLLSKTELNSEQAAYLSVVQQNASHLKSLVGDILEYAKIEAGKIKIDKDPFSIRDVTFSIASTTKALMLGRPVEVETVIDPDLSSVFLGDAKRIRQILLNLSANAASFTKRGTITIKVFEKVKSADRPIIRFEVIDTGPGIAPSLQEKIFEFYEREDNLELSSEGSTGLGLAISKALVKLMEGEIGVVSDGENGARFWFDLPLYIAQPLAIEYTEDPTQFTFDLAAPKLNIMIAEDSKSSRLLLETIIRKLGHNIFSCKNGLEALEAARLKRFDIIFMDIQMPEMDGIDATRAIRKIAGYKDALIFALTADTFLEKRPDISEVGFNRIILKPFDSETLVKIIYDVQKSAQ
jgi:signal transduction histidine kinase